EIHERISSDGSTSSGVFNSLLNRRPPLLRNRTAENLVHELESRPSRLPLKNTSRLAKLTAAAGLFLVTAHDLRPPLEGLEVPHLWWVKLHLNALALLPLVAPPLPAGLPA